MPVKGHSQKKNQAREVMFVLGLRHLSALCYAAIYCEQLLRLLRRTVQHNGVTLYLIVYKTNYRINTEPSVVQ